MLQAPARKPISRSLWPAWVLPAIPRSKIALECLTTGQWILMPTFLSSFYSLQLFKDLLYINKNALLTCLTSYSSPSLTPTGFQGGATKPPQASYTNLLVTIQIALERQSKNQDGGVGRHTVPPRTTRTDRKLNSKEVRHQVDKKETYIQIGRRGGDGHRGGEDSRGRGRTETGGVWDEWGRQSDH